MRTVKMHHCRLHLPLFLRTVPPRSSLAKQPAALVPRLRPRPLRSFLATPPASSTTEMRFYWLVPHLAPPSSVPADRSENEEGGTFS